MPFKNNFFYGGCGKEWLPQMTIKENENEHCLQCWCYETQQIKTMSNLFLTSSIAQKLWKYFVSWAGLDTEGRNSMKMIKRYSYVEAPTKLKHIFRVMSTLIMWICWRKGIISSIGSVHLWWVGTTSGKEHLIAGNS